MCRIAGFIDRKDNLEYNLSDTIAAMRDTLIVGGPDDCGLFISQKNGLGLGHRRLSILDLSQLGHQPMEFENLVIVYNGEVYNFGEVKDELINAGYSFESTSDTEVVLKAYHKWGMDCLEKFRGMWAFAIWDKSEEKLILCRDRVGVKPLYWHYHENLFMFASELKAFHKHPRFCKEINQQALSLYLQHGYISAPYSIFKNTYKLEPGSFLIFNKNGEIVKEKYWSVEDFYAQGFSENKKWNKRSEESITEELENILTESFKLRMVADVPVGMFLSGGIDSSLVTALLQKEYTRPLKTFTIGFYEERYNEAVWAKKVANYLGTDHTELYCTPKEAFDIVPQLSELYDEPFGDSSAIPTFLVSKLAKQSVKVSLSADGGDEQFCGYNRYWLSLINNNKIAKLSYLSFIINRLSPESAESIYKKLKFIFPKIDNFKDKYKRLQKIIQDQKIKENDIDRYDRSVKSILEQELNDLGLKEIITQNRFKNFNYDIHSQMMIYDLNTYMVDDILIKVDRATMGVSLEGREPFLDNKILEFSSMLPMKYKMQKNKSKYILRKILNKYIPNELIERPKQGFGVPVNEWFRSDLKDLYLQYLNPDKISKHNLYSAEYVNKLLKDYLDGGRANSVKLWFLFVFEMWYEKWMD